MYITGGGGGLPGGVLGGGAPGRGGGGSTTSHVDSIFGGGPGSNFMQHSWLGPKQT